MLRTFLIAIGLLAGCGKDEATKAPPRVEKTTPAPVDTVPLQTKGQDAVVAAVAAADRSAEDRALDAGRKPGELLTFLRVTPGMKVAEVMAGGGYTVELLARVVGDNGVVYGENPKLILERFAEKPWTERLAKPVNARVVRVDRELDDPLPAEARELDLVVSHLIYHDLFWLGVDRSKHNAAILAALRPGGEYAIIDHSAAAGAGSSVTQTLHRIEPGVIQAEVEAAGFVLDREGDFLRHAADTRDWTTSPGAAGDKRGTSDRFVLVFRKP